MKSKHPIAFVALLIIVVGVGAFLAGFWLGQQQAQKTQVAALGDRSTAVDTSNRQTLFSKIIQRSREQVYDDEQKRSHLTDDEARVTLDWASHWIENEVLTATDESSAEELAQSALTHVRSVINAIYALRQSGRPESK